MQTVIENTGVSSTQTEKLKAERAAERAMFGDGSYSQMGKEVYKDTQRIFKLDPAIAETVAKRIMSDFGAVMAKADRSSKIGKTSKDGKVTVKEAVTAVKGVTITDSLYCLRAINFANEAGKVGFDATKIVWSADVKLTEWFDSLS